MLRAVLAGGLVAGGACGEHPAGQVSYVELRR